MSSRKQMTDDELAEMGRKLATMHELSIAVWSDAMKVMLINSAMYRQICATGRKVQTTYMALQEEAYRRHWPDEQIRAVFSSRTGCGFS